jgi:hypothetical protein
MYTTYLYYIYYDRPCEKVQICLSVVRATPVVTNFFIGTEIVIVYLSVRYSLEDLLRRNILT